MKSYYRVMLGEKSMHAEECFSGNFIGVDFDINQDLTNIISDNWREFNKAFIPIYLKAHSGKTKIAAGLACGSLWMMARGILNSDVVLSPDGSGRYRAGEVIGDYSYQPGGILPHRRSMRWINQPIDRGDMSPELQNSTKSAVTVTNITGHSDEIEKLIGGISAPRLISTDETVEDPSAFAMEKHLEDFLVQNWAHTDFSKEYAIYEEDGELVGQQYPTDTGAIDILATSKNGKSLLVIELKKGRASDVVVGQILRYMGYVKETLAEKGQAVKGVIIALDDDKRIRRALAMIPDIDFYRYQISFKLKKA